MAVRAVSSVVGRLVQGGAVLCLSSGVFTRQFTSDAVLKNLFIAKEFYSYASNYGPAVVRSAVFQQEATSPAVGSVEAWRAHRNGRLAFGFSAGGLLFPYYIGVADVFQRNSVIKSGETHLAGASAGSLIAACFNAGVPVDVMVRAVLELAKDCRENGTRGRLKAVLERHLVELLPTNAHQRCSGNTFVAVTQALPYAKGELVSEFSSKEDLIDALLTSCHIPVFFGGSVLTSFRGRYCYDGGVTNFIPLPPSAQHGVRVCCFPAGSIHSQEGIHIAPDLFGRSPYTFTELVNWAFEPAKESVLLRLVEKGRQDAQGWLWQMRRQAQTAAAAQDAARLGRGVPLVDGLSIQC